MAMPSKPTPANCQMRDLMVFLSMKHQLSTLAVYREQCVTQMK
jgi:hypothetical protein